MTDQELIQAVAEKVMGFDLSLQSNKWFDDGSKFNPITNANHWMMVVEKMRTKIFSFKAWGYATGDYRVFFTCDIQGDVASYSEKNSSIGRAVCLAALEAVKDYLPSIDDLSGKHPDMTGEMSSEEYIRKMREE